MKKIIYILILIVLSFNIKNSYSQGFTYTPVGPTYVWHPYIPDSIQSVKHSAIIRNTSASYLDFRFARILNNMPSAKWYTQMCYDLCYAEQVDTISLPSKPPYSIPPNHQDTLFYILFNCEGEGTGTATVRMYNTANPSLYVDNTFIVQIGGVGITPISSVVEDYSLSQNYPNPFNPVTNINFSIPESQKVSLKVYNAIGNEVETLIDNQNLTQGIYKVDFNAIKFSSGIYYYTLRTENFVDTKKMILVK